MLNEEKVALMTKMAIYEKNEGKSDFKISKYYRSDYVGLNMINSAIIITLMYLAVLAAIVFVNIEKVLSELMDMDLLAIGRTAVLWYLVILAVYLVLAFIVYSVKYRRARNKIKSFDNNLRKLYKICKAEYKSKATLWQEEHENND